MKIQSNGMGVQSIAMYLMSSLGELPRFDYSIFADPGAEKQATYKYIEWLKKWAKENNGIPIVHDKSKNLYKDLLNQANSTNNRFASIPAYTLNEDGSTGMVRRQCTNEYKINVIYKAINKIFELKKGQSWPEEVRLYIGISLDEIHRVSIPERKNLIHVYPFCNYVRTKEYGKFLLFPSMTRNDIIQWMKSKGFELPVKSSCVFCPFQHNENWKKLKKNKADFESAIKIDRAIRNVSSKGNMNGQMFLHKSCKPIEEVDFSENQTEINYDCMGFCDV